ncbi:MAG: hypothetical protein LKF53_08225 [Solobacterium sp.]|jgi:hypothetical protein|nr:hypothetical protein [Solobacterium sp.]MCH4206363.1 hypothetical protein [Solobacterium sp.]MCH4227865.1 hypothetical protein [Solobacterium sp.]MCH4283243.1 hypothetical protein [Solobacterium sp.]
MEAGLNEAVNTANDALFHLQKADEILGHAENWGFVDLFAGGMIATMIKRSKMSDAKKEIEQAKRSMQRLSGYLQDFRGMPNMTVDMNGFLGFADYFFDGVVADWFVQTKINDARRQVKDAISEVQGILDGLEEMQ